MPKHKPIVVTVTQDEIEKHLNPCSMFCPLWATHHNGLCPHKIVLNATDPLFIVDVCGLHPIKTKNEPTELERAAALANSKEATP